MDVKILPWDRDTTTHVLNEKQLIMISKVTKKGDDSNVMLPFNRVDYKIYNINEKTIETILPNLSKFEAAEFYYATKENDMVYFIHLEYSSYPMATFILFRYDTVNNICKEIYRYDDNINNYDESSLKIFILTNQYVMIQIEKKNKNINENRYVSFLYDTKNKLTYDILDERLTHYGISQFIYVANNVCALRFGKNHLYNDMLYTEEERYDKESICLISISQFIADILLRINIFSSEIIDEVYMDKTFTDIKKLGKYIVFSRINSENGYQEMFFYQYITKELSMLLNNNYYSPKDVFPCVMNGLPMVVRLHKKKYDFYNLKGERVVIKLSADNEILYCNNDFLITSSSSGLFKTGKRNIDIYQFSSMKRLYREKITPISFISVNKDSLLILVEDNND